MDLWTEFEGATIDSAYSLKRLLQTEGRSAFFSTQNANGDPVLIRIIECHFDEDEILARWRGIETLGNPAILRIDRFGQFLIEEDEITAVYAVFERVDENLAHVLERGRLSAADAIQIGRSVASALETLHASGFVHEHVEARNIYAVGETVKMRSDCIRETPEGETGVDARRRDVHDLAVLLVQVLRGMKGATFGRAPLPAPFDEIVHNGMNGQWGLTEIQLALAPGASEKGSSEKKQARKATEPAAIRDAAPAQKISSDAQKPAAEKTPQAAPDNSVTPHAAAAKSAPAEPAQEWTGGRAGRVAEPDTVSQFLRRRAAMEVPVIFGISQEDMRRWMTAGGALLAVVLLGAMLIHHWTASPAPANTQPESASTQRPQDAVPQAVSSPATPAAAPAAAPNARWRVVVFTYNRKDQAEKKALSLSQKFPALSAAVFSPTSRAPWLVTIGGVLQRDAAYALARKARSMGLPRDTYAQNYNAH
jgi:eukaryotic-like serine/threonine-protein kinase